MKKLNCTFSREEFNINLSNQPTYRQLDMKLVKVTEVSKELLELCSTECFLTFYNGEELVLSYAPVVKQKLYELGVEFTVVEV